MPPSEKFVPPVQTASGTPSFERTMNLLWAMYDLFARLSRETSPSAAAATAARFRSVRLGFSGLPEGSLRAS